MKISEKNNLGILITMFIKYNYLFRVLTSTASKNEFFFLNGNNKCFYQQWFIS